MKRKLMIIFSFCLLCFLFVFSTNSFADPYADNVVLFDQPAGSSNVGVAGNALGAADNKYVSIDIPETLILAFTDNEVFDGAGNDLYIYEVDNGDSRVDVYVSQDNIMYHYLGASAYGNTYYDLSGTGLSYVNYVKFVGLDNGGGSPGFDLDAVEALNSRDIGTGLPEPASLLLLGFGLMGLAGARRKIRK